MTSAAPKATLGGVPIQYGFSWTVASGVNPVQQQFVMSTARAEKIFKRARRQIPGKASKTRTLTREEASQIGPLELVVESPGWPTLRAKGLYVVEVHPVDDTKSAVLVADVRWLLGRKFRLREFNLRRPTGEFHLVQGALTPIQVNDPVEDYDYKRVSLDNGKVWTARRVLEDLLPSLVGKAFKISKSLNLDVPIEGLSLEDTGTATLARALDYLPGAEVYPDLDGRLVVYNTLDGSEGRLIEDLKAKGRKLWGSTVTKIDRALVRPTEFVQFFEQEVELRFDYTEGSRQTRQRGRPPREVENVLPVVHPTVTLDGRTYARGSWLQVDDWITATQAELDKTGDTIPGEFRLSHDMFRRHALTGFRIPRDFLAGLNAGISSPIFDQVFGAISAHWRKTFRIGSRYMDQLKGIRAIRAAVLDQETGTRARAEAFLDYMIRPTVRGLVKKANETCQAGYNYTSWAEDLADAAPAPARVQVLDPANGIFRVELEVDPFGEAQEIHPGKLDTSTGKVPSWDLASAEGLAGAYVAWNSPLVFLAEEYKLSVILTVTRAAPTNETRLHAERVTPAEASKVLPGNATVGECLGSPWETKAGAAIETARFAWSDSLADQIDQAIWEGRGMPSELLVNPTSLKNVAVANAGRTYASLLDRHEGTMSVSLDPSIKPTGSLASVTHTLAKGGAAVTTLTLPPITEAIDIWALMPDSTRKVLLRQIES